MRLSLKHIIVLFLKILNTQNLVLLKLSPSCLLSKYAGLKFHKFQPRYSYKICSYGKKSVYG